MANFWDYNDRFNFDNVPDGPAPLPACPYCGHELTQADEGELILCSNDETCGGWFIDRNDIDREAATVNAGATPYYSTNGEW